MMFTCPNNKHISPTTKHIFSKTKYIFPQINTLCLKRVTVWCLVSVTLFKHNNVFIYDITCLECV